MAATHFVFRSHLFRAQGAPRSERCNQLPRSSTPCPDETFASDQSPSAFDPTKTEPHSQRHRATNTTAERRKPRNATEHPDRQTFVDAKTRPRPKPRAITGCRKQTYPSNIDRDNERESKVGTLCVAQCGGLCVSLRKFAKPCRGTNRAVLACGLILNIAAPHLETRSGMRLEF